MLLDQHGNPLLPKNLDGGRASRSVFASTLNWKARVKNPDGLGYDTYERMVETDETIGAALEFIELSVCAYLGEYTHPKPKIQKFVRRFLVEMRSDLSTIVTELLSALWVGSADLELWLTERDGKIVPVDLPAIHPRNRVYEMETEGINSGSIKAVVQKTLTEEISIEAERTIHLQHRGRFGNPYGLSRLRGIYKNWFIKDSLVLPWAQTLERYGSPIAIGRTTDSDRKEKNGKTRGENLLEALVNMHNSAVLVLPTGEEVSFEQVTRSFGSDFESAQNHFNKMMMRGLLMPSLLFEASDIGSFAMVNKHLEVFVRWIRRLVGQVARAIILQGVRPVVFWNFGAQETYGEFKAQQLEEEDLELWSKIFFSMIQAGVLRPEVLVDFEWIREKFGAPKGVDPPEESVIGSAGRDGLPGEAPDGQDDAESGEPRGAKKRPTKGQGRPEEDEDGEDD